MMLLPMPMMPLRYDIALPALLTGVGIAADAKDDVCCAHEARYRCLRVTAPTLLFAAI